MAMSLRNPRASELARAVARETGETLTQAVITSLEERLVRLRGRKRSQAVYDEIMDVSRRCRSLPDLDGRSADEILGYDEKGVPGGH